MAVLFDDASSENLTRSSAVVTAPPFTFSAWFNSDSVTVNQQIIGVGNNGTNGAFRLALIASGDILRFQAQSEIGANENSDASVSYTVNTTHHAMAVCQSTSSRQVYLDGGNVGTNTNALTSPNCEFTTIGANRRSTTNQYFSGWVAEAAIWDTAITDPAIRTALAAGYSPRLFPDGLVAYWPLIRLTSGVAIDIVGGNDLTQTNTPTATAHPRIINPAESMIGHNAAAVVSGFPPTMFKTNNIGSTGIR